MHKIFSLFLLIVLYGSIVFGQPTVLVPLVATEDIVQNMSVGLDLTATNCIDVSLGEAEAPPPPPPGAFHIVFDLAPYGCGPLTVWKDYRNAPSFPYTGVVQHTINVQRSAPGSIINLAYILPTGATMVLTDAITGTIYTSGTLTGTGNFSISGVGASLSNFWLTLNYVDVTPVELSSFNAIFEDMEVKLDWTTASELNNQGFDIERSTSAQNWAKIGYVPGFGTTTERRAYSFVDKNVSTGYYNYRLKQIDFDGTFAYSDEVGVEVDFTPSNYELFQNYPNPFNPTTTIQFQVPQAGNVSIVIFDMLGQVVKELFADNVQAGNYSVDWNGLNSAGQKMSSGSYIYRMTAGEFVQSKEMILLK